MKAVIVGCGRVGAALADRARPRRLAGPDHRPLDVGLRPAAVHVRGDGAPRRRHGRGHPAPVRAPGADLFLALTEGDNRNVMAAQLAVEALGARRVVAKINDPVRAEAYAHLGIASLCRTNLMTAPSSATLGQARRAPGIYAPENPHRTWAGAAAPVAQALAGASPPGAPGRPAPGAPSPASAPRRHDRHGGLSDVRAGRRRREGRLLPDQGAHRVGHEVALMEKDRARAQQITDEIGSIVIAHDGCEGKYLNEAGANRADIVAAVTGDDEDNLVICQMAKHHFDVPRTIARVNNPKNEELFRHLGVDEIISPTRMVLGSIEQDIPVHELLHLAALGVGELEIIEAHLQPGSPAIGKIALDLSVPGGCSLFGVIRDGRADAAPERHGPRRGRQGDRDRPSRLRGAAAGAAHRGARPGLTRRPGRARRQTGRVQRSRTYCGYFS